MWYFFDDKNQNLLCGLPSKTLLLSFLYFSHFRMPEMHKFDPVSHFWIRLVVHNIYGIHAKHIFHCDVTLKIFFRMTFLQFLLSLPSNSNVIYITTQTQDSTKNKESISFHNKLSSLNFSTNNNNIASLIKYVILYVGKKFVYCLFI